MSSIQGLPAVHSRPSCFQPGQHARPAGGLWDREGTSDGDRGGHQMGTGAGYVCVQLQGSLANMKLKRGVPPPGARSRTRGSREAPGALLRKEVGKIEGNLRRCSQRGPRGWCRDRRARCCRHRGYGAQNQGPDALGEAQRRAGDPKKRQQSTVSMERPMDKAK